jgi:hypothetical protein
MNEQTKRIAKMIGSRLVAHGIVSVHMTNPRLIIHNPSGVDDGAYYPASDISVCGEQAIRDLRDFCNELLGESEKKS